MHASCNSNEIKMKLDPQTEATPQHKEYNAVATPSSNLVNIVETIKIEKSATKDENKEMDDLGVKNMSDNYNENYTAFIEEIKTMSSIPILKSISEDSISNFKYYNKRYYEDKYCVYFGITETGYNDTNIRIHTNKLILVALANGNDIVRSQKDISEINFVVNDVDRSKIQLSGKKKRGSKTVEPHTILCQVKYEGSDKLYNIRAGVNGNIIEINELIKNRPNLIKTDPQGLGFIAVIAPKGKPSDYETQISKLNLLSEEEYFEYLLQRAPSPCLP